MAIYVCRKKGSGDPRVQHKTVDAESSLLVVLPDGGYDVLGSVTINPQTHSDSYTPQPNTASNDMGAVHNKRYVNTSGMIVPSGNKYIDTNGSGIDVSSYSTVEVNVDSPEPILEAGEGTGETLTRVYTPTAGTDGFFEFTVYPQNHSEPFLVTNRTTYDMGKNHNYRYIDATGVAEQVTNLWENIDPESAFTPQGIPIIFTSTQIDSSKLRISYSDIMTRTVEYNAVTVPLSRLVTYTVPSSLTVYNASRYFARPFIYDNSNQELTFMDCQRIGGSTTNNNMAIPLSIDLIS